MPELKQITKQLRNSFLSTHVSESLKIHVVTTHVENCINYLDNGGGLGLWSEQTGESNHAEFLKFWER